VFGAAAAIAVYLATVGAFVALRVGGQRAAYMVTILSLGVLPLPLLLQLVHLHVTLSWLTSALLFFAALDAVLLAIGGRLFRRELLVLYPQE
jgi:hypothetical protein